MNNNQQLEGMREVAIAYLQSPITIPGVLDTATVLSPSKTPRVRMYSGQGNLWLSIGETLAAVPEANVKVMLFK